MKRIICLILCLALFQTLFAQDTSIVEKAYLKVLKDGFSTAPEFIVITVKNLNTGKSKEICTEVTSLLWCLQQEHNADFGKSLKQYLFAKSNSRTFALKDTTALNDVDFYNYALKDESKIDRLIKNTHLRDSLKKTNEERSAAWHEYQKYENIRHKLLLNFSDSISKIQPLTEEEKQIIEKLRYPSYEETYTDPKTYDYQKLSDKGVEFMESWNQKVLPYKAKCIVLSKESRRLYQKFFQTYYDKYGMNFCHVAFKNGIITYIGDEVAVVGFGDIVD